MVLRHCVEAVVILPSADGERNLYSHIQAHVGARIQFRRIQRGLSRESVASRLGISPDLLKKYESGRMRVKAEHLLAIAVILETSMGYFFEEFDLRDRNSRLDS